MVERGAGTAGRSRTGTRRAVGLAVALAVMAVLAACDPEPGSGLVLRGLSPTTGLEPGDVVSVRIAGVDPGEEVAYGLCGDSVACAPTREATAGDGGAVTVSITTTATAPYLDAGGDPRSRACRPDRCYVVARTADGESAALRLGFSGGKVQATVSPSTGLVDGSLVSVAGSVPGAGGRTVRITQECATDGCSFRLVLADVVLDADGRFSTSVAVVRQHPSHPEQTCWRAEGGRPCSVAIRVLKTPVSFDMSYGTASQALRFATPRLTMGLSATDDLTHGQVVTATGEAPAGRTVEVRQLKCSGGLPGEPRECDAGPSASTTVAAAGTYAVDLALVREVGVECNHERYPWELCSVEARLLAPGGEPDPTVAPVEVSVRFEPSPLDLTLSRTTGLEDGDVVTASGTVPFGAGRTVVLRQSSCADLGGGELDCTVLDPSATAVVAADGTFSAELTLTRLVGYDCGRGRFPVPECVVEAFVDDGFGDGDPDPVFATDAVVTEFAFVGDD